MNQKRICYITAILFAFGTLIMICDAYFMPIKYASFIQLVCTLPHLIYTLYKINQKDKNEKYEDN